MVAHVLPVPLTARAGFIAMAGLLSVATLGAALLPTLTHAAPAAPRVIDLPRVHVAGVHIAAGAVLDLPRVVVAGHRTAPDTRLAVKKAMSRV